MDGLSGLVMVAAASVATQVGFRGQASVYRRQLGVHMTALDLDFADVYPMPVACSSVALSASWRADFLVHGCMFVDIVALDAPVSSCIRRTRWEPRRPLGILLDYTCSELVVQPFMLRSHQPRIRPHWPTTLSPSTTS